jgi:uncharacterized protein YdhG (YjbR/CyaY superfamily)
MEETVDAYLGELPTFVAEGLQAVRRSLLSGFPTAVESMRLQMPTYDCAGEWFSMVADEDELVFYLGENMDAWAESVFDSYSRHKSGLRIPAEQPVPVDAILTSVERLFGA